MHSWSHATVFTCLSPSHLPLEVTDEARISVSNWLVYRLGRQSAFRSHESRLLFFCHVLDWPWGSARPPVCSAAWSLAARVKYSESEAYHLLPSVMKVKNVWHSKCSLHCHIRKQWLCARYWAKTECSLIVLHFTAEFSVGCFSPLWKGKIPRQAVLH
jgi:hypothetical protein